MKKINKKALPAIILIIVIMIIGFGMQFFITKNSIVEAEMNEQTKEYIDKVNQCQAAADSKQELSKECQEIMKK